MPQNAQLTWRSFKLKIAEDTWNDEVRIKVNVVRADPINFTQESALLVAYQKDLLQGKPIMQPLPQPSGAGQQQGGPVASGPSSVSPQGNRYAGDGRYMAPQQPQYGG